MAPLCSAARRRGPRSAGAGCRSRGPAGRSGCRGGASSPGGGPRCARAISGGQLRHLVPRPLDGVQRLGLHGCWRGPPRRSGRPARRGPSRGSRSARGQALAHRPGSCPRAGGSPPRRRPPARRCRRCSSAPPPRARGGEAAHERVAQDRVAEVADVGGLVGVDVRVLDDGAAPGARQRPLLQRGEEVGTRATPVPGEEQVHIAAAGHLGPEDQRRGKARQAKASAISRGVRRKLFARSKGAVSARSPSPGGAGIGTRRRRARRRRRPWRRPARRRRGGAGGRVSFRVLGRVLKNHPIAVRPGPSRVQSLSFRTGS